MSDQRASSPSPVRRSTSQDEDPKVLQAQANARKGMQRRKKKSLWDKYAYHIVIGGFLVLCGSALFSILFSKSKKIHQTPVVDLEEIELHNSQNLSFVLGPNDFFEGSKLSDAKPLFNNQFTFRSSLVRCMASDESTIVESSHDFRTAQPKCVNPVNNQGNCSSSFAVAPASALSDRYCLQTNGEENVDLSAQAYLGCDAASKNCEGGAIASFLDHAKKEGVPSKSEVPYTGEKNKTCPEAAKGAKRYTALDYCVASSPEAIKREILKNGPVVALIPVYRDWLVYKSGVYYVIEGTSRFQGSQAIKVIGWGKNEEDGQDYWVIENSWGTSWGENGYGKIAIGQKNLNMDEFVMAVTPRVDRVITDATTTPGDQGAQPTETQNLDESQ